jgi:hypothetical protein
MQKQFQYIKPVPFIPNGTGLVLEIKSHFILPTEKNDFFSVCVSLSGMYSIRLPD